MKIFVLLPRIPYPIEKGDKLRAFNHIRYLSGNHTLVLCALNDDREHPEARKSLQQYCDEIHFIRLTRLSIFINVLRALFSGKPLQVGYFYSKKGKRKINKLLKKHKPDHIFCQLVRSAEYLNDVTIPKTLDYQDVFSMGVQRRIKSAPFYLKPVFKMEYKRLLHYEYTAFERFDHKVIISKPDRDLIPHPEREKIHIIPNGVDQDFFKPVEREKKYDLIFTGNMGYPPNINGSEYLVHEIMPLVWKERPETNVAIVGANPHQRVKALARDKIEVTGWVEDIREYYAHARTFIAPMQIGTGLQNKLLEAMAMKIPSITSALANGALNAQNGKEIMVAESAPEFAFHILQLLSNDELAHSIAENGYTFVTRHYNWANATAKLEGIMKSSASEKNLK
ncbi:MAG: glycosyltransferase [Bacteroidales bacterium]|nr:glycosyltransferase [Bacteroidales bacterium]